MSKEETGQRRTDGHEDGEAMARIQEEINNLPVGEHLVFMLHSLSSLAVDRLGLAPDATARKDPAQARLSIEAFRALLTVLEPERPAAEISTYRSMLSQLQMAYVGALGTGTAPGHPQAAEEGPDGAAPAEGSATTEAAEADEVPKKTNKPRTGVKSSSTSSTGSGPKGGVKVTGGAGSKGGSGTKKSS
jgi:uncharacterized membrane protein YgcG